MIVSKYNQSVQIEKMSTNRELIDWITRHYDFEIHEKNETKPWGGYWVIHEKDTDRFAKTFFHEFPNTPQNKTCKFLFICPHKRLSLQIHQRRSEVWKVVYGNVHAILDNSSIHLFQHEQLVIPVDSTHRLMGTEDWSIVAEMWIHQDPQNPSDENDIVRVQDDFSR